MRLKGFYRTIFAGYANHALLGRYLNQPTPDFPNIYDDVYKSLSGGEQVLVDIALALYNGDGTAKIADLFLLDKKHQLLVLDAINQRLGFSHD